MILFFFKLDLSTSEHPTLYKFIIVRALNVIPNEARELCSIIIVVDTCQTCQIRSSQIRNNDVARHIFAGAAARMKTE